MKTTHRRRLVLAVGGLFFWFLMTHPCPSACAFQFNDVISIGAAYTTHLFFHEIGHQIVAKQVGATGSRMRFFTNSNGKIYPGLSTYTSIPEKSKLPYSLGGERMAGFTFDYALKSYRKNPSTFNKALMFFSCADFLTYTLLANYFHPSVEMYDPNIIREEMGCSKGLLLSLVMGKTLLNAYRVVDPQVNFAPEVWVGTRSAALLVRFPF